MSNRKFKVYDSSGDEVSIRKFTAGDVVIARVKKEMTPKEFKEFCNSNMEMEREFRARNIRLIFCPDWVEFKEWA